MKDLAMQLGLGFKDVFFIGVLVGIWWVHRGRRGQGERLGAVEQDVRELLALLRPTREAIISQQTGGEHVR